jgi:mitosis inhibitor protein kinase SWE1
MPPPPLPALAQKKAVSLDRLAQVGEMDEAFGSVAAPTAAMGHARKSSRGQINTTRHRRLQSSDGLAAAGGISRSSGQKSGLSANLNGLPDFSTSNSSLSSMATSHMTPPASEYSPMPLPVFEDVRPLQEAFDQPTTTLTRKFKPRDSGVAMPEARPLEPPPSVLRPTAYRTLRPSLNTMQLQHEPSHQTPIDEETRQAAPTFGFLGNSGLLIHARSADKLAMPDTPIKRQARASEPSRSTRTSLQQLDPNMQVESGPSIMKDQWRSHPNSSPSGHQGSDSQSDPDNTPTKMPIAQHCTSLLSLLQRRSGLTIPVRRMPAQTPMKAFAPDRVQTLVQPRMSLPALPNPKVHRTLHHRQSHPTTRPKNEEDDIFENRFILLETLGKGAFSTVVKVQDRHGEGLWAVKKARGVFDGVRDRYVSHVSLAECSSQFRLRHLEEVDILKLLSQPANPHVLRFESAWEQNRQLFIQTELCLGTLAFFLEEYGRVVERLDEGRVWKIIRELSDGVHHIHANGVIHFDLKPANILIDDRGQLKIGDFGLASRYPRVPPAKILEGSGLGGSVTALEGSLATANWQRLDREGDRQYMPPEMLRGVYSMPADIFS